jgi:hypothetical protein
MVLVFGMTVAGCDNDPDNSGPQWVTATGDDATPFTGALSPDGKSLDITFWDDKMGEDFLLTFTKNSGGLDGVWYTVDKAGRLTISGTNWTLAGSEGKDDPKPPQPKYDNDESRAARASIDYYDYMKGTLAVNGSTITFTPTHVMSDFGEDGKGNTPPPDPADKSLIVHLETGEFSQYKDGVFSWDNEKTSGVIGIVFYKPRGILTVSELSWLTTASFSISVDTGDRTLSINGIEKKQDDHRVLVILSCTRSAGCNNEESYETATLSVTVGGGFVLFDENTMQFIF